MSTDFSCLNLIGGYCYHYQLFIFVDIITDVATTTTNTTQKYQHNQLLLKT